MPTSGIPGGPGASTEAPSPSPDDEPSFLDDTSVAEAIEQDDRTFEEQASQAEASKEDIYRYGPSSTSSREALMAVVNSTAAEFGAPSGPGAVGPFSASETQDATAIAAFSSMTVKSPTTSRITPDRWSAEIPPALRNMLTEYFTPEGMDRLVQTAQGMASLNQEQAWSAAGQSGGAMFWLAAGFCRGDNVRCVTQPQYSLIDSSTTSVGNRTALALMFRESFTAVGSSRSVSYTGDVTYVLVKSTSKRGAPWLISSLSFSNPRVSIKENARD